jgi:hypothetical protein
MRPHDLPFTEHFQSLPCGTRAKYVAGRCRCLRCRAANSSYETARAAARRRGEWNGLVSAERARQQLVALSRQGVGRRAVSAACDVGETTLQEIRSGAKTQIRAATERRILAVTKDAIADHALVGGGRTHQRLRRLLEEGFTKTELARRLGSTAKVPALQLTPGRVTARNAMKVERLYRLVMAEGPVT